MEVIPVPPPPVLERIWNVAVPRKLQSIDYRDFEMVEAGGVEPYLSLILRNLLIPLHRQLR